VEKEFKYLGVMIGEREPWFDRSIKCAATMGMRALWATWRKINKSGICRIDLKLKLMKALVVL